MNDNTKRIDLNDRESISIGIVRKVSLKRIAALLGRHVTSISNEIKKHRTLPEGIHEQKRNALQTDVCQSRTESNFTRSSILPSFRDFPGFQK